MKLFKKLAAVVLAAALALTMVGCGGNSYAMQNELLKLSIDYMSDTVTHTKKADDLAAALLAAADTAAKVNLIDNVQFKSSGMMDEYLKMDWMASVTSPSKFYPIGTFHPGNNDKGEIGAATHKIGDKSYILILVTYTPTTPSIT